MAFDMFAGQLHEAISFEEEVIFQLAEKDKRRFPNLLHVWSQFYKDPRLSPLQASRLSNELVELLASNGGAGNQVLHASATRLALFFKDASRSDQEIRCQSD